VSNDLDLFAGVKLVLRILGRCAAVKIERQGGHDSREDNGFVPSVDQGHFGDLSTADVAFPVL
jgi:hypothetical protein